MNQGAAIVGAMPSIDISIPGMPPKKEVSRPKSRAIDNRKSGTVKARPTVSRWRWWAISLSRATCSASSALFSVVSGSKPAAVIARRRAAWLTIVGT